MKGQRGKEINEAIIFFKGSGVLPVLFQVDGSDRIAEFGSIQCQHALKDPLLSMYRLSAQATLYADHFMMIMSVVMVGMAYQMPVGVGLIQGGGDTKFSMYLKSDQIFKCLPIFLRFKSYKWIHKLTG